jgi:hypothetical protein
MATRRLSRTPSFNMGRQSPKDDISVLENKYISVPEELFTTNLNLLNIEASLLSNIILAIFKRFIITIDYQKVSPLALKEFVIDVCDTYKDVPYHNLHHATNVLHSTFILINKCGLFDQLNHDVLFGCLIAALVHDIGHPGNNNLFEINTCSELALRYNDLSVLEQYHCSIAFELIKKHKLNSLLSHNEFILFRKTIITSILGTDMAHHKSMTDLLATKKVSGFNLTSMDEQILLCKMLLHAADIGNPIHPPELCEEWARLVGYEFHNQIVKEKELGLNPFSSLDITCDISFFSSEIGFMTYVCLPYWKTFSDIYPELCEELENIKINLQVFTEKLAAAERKNSVFFEKYS